MGMRSRHLFGGGQGEVEMGIGTVWRKLLAM